MLKNQLVTISWHDFVFVQFMMSHDFCDVEKYHVIPTTWATNRRFSTNVEFQRSFS